MCSVAADAGLDYRAHVRSWAIKSRAAPMPGTVGNDPDETSTEEMERPSFGRLIVA